MLFLLVTVGPLAGGRGRPTELLASDAEPPASPAADAGRPQAASYLHGLHVEKGLLTPPPAAPPTVPVHELAFLSAADAARLEGRRLRWRVAMAGPTDRQGDEDVYEVQPENDPQGILRLRAGPEVKGFVVVDTTLKVIRHPRIVVGPVDVKAFTEYRLVDAALAGP